MLHDENKLRFSDSKHIVRYTREEKIVTFSIRSSSSLSMKKEKRRSRREMKNYTAVNDTPCAHHPTKTTLTVSQSYPIQVVFLLHPPCFLCAFRCVRGWLGKKGTKEKLEEEKFLQLLFLNYYSLSYKQLLFRLLWDLTAQEVRRGILFYFLYIFTAFFEANKKKILECLNEILRLFIVSLLRVISKICFKRICSRVKNNQQWIKRIKNWIDKRKKKKLLSRKWKRKVHA